MLKGQFHGTTNPQIVHWKDIGPLELKHQMHLHRPLAQSFDLGP